LLQPCQHPWAQDNVHACQFIPPFKITHTTCILCMAIMRCLSAWSTITCPTAECHTSSMIQCQSLVSHVLMVRSSYVDTFGQHLSNCVCCSRPAFSLWEQADQVGQLQQQQCLSCPLHPALIVAAELLPRTQKPLRWRPAEPMHKHTQYISCCNE